MGKLIPLPKLADLPEVVLFHRAHPADPRLMLQVPLGSEDAETYVVRLDNIDHKQWVERLPNHQWLTDMLSYEMHVSYYPHRNGTVMRLEDPYEIPWVAQAFAQARVQQSNPLEGFFAKRKMRNRLLPVAPLKRALRGGA